MNKPLLAAVIGAATTALALGAGADAWAAPAGVGSAEETVQALEAGGYRVVVDKVGDRPLHQCSVAAVQPGGSATQPMSSGERDGRQTVLLTAKC